MCSELKALNDHIALLTRENDELRKSKQELVLKEHLDSVPFFSLCAR
jgi:hypothetical protein